MLNGQKPKIDRQREHQANERTFLAWLRTSIALIGFGFAIARFGLFLRELQSAVTGQDAPTGFVGSQGLGLCLVLAGLLLIVLAAWRYNQVFQQIERGDYQPRRLIVWITTAMVIILAILSIPLVLWRQPSVPKSPASPKSSRSYPKYTQLSSRLAHSLWTR